MPKTMTEEFEKYRKLIIARAWKWHGLTGVPFDDLQSEGTLIFMKCLHAFKEEEGTSFMTYFYTSLDHGLARFATDQQYEFCTALETEFVNEEEEVIKDTNLIYHDPILERAALKEAICKMSSEAKSVVMLVLYSPSELVPFYKTDGITGMRIAIRRYLKSVGWKKKTVNFVFREIREALNTL